MQRRHFTTLRRAAQSPFGRSPGWAAQSLRPLIAVLEGASAASMAAPHDAFRAGLYRHFEHLVMAVTARLGKFGIFPILMDGGTVASKNRRRTATESMRYTVRHIPAIRELNDSELECVSGGATLIDAFNKGIVEGADLYRFHN